MEHAGGQGYGGGVGEVKPSSSAESYTSDPAPRPKHDGTAIASVGMTVPTQSTFESPVSHGAPPIEPNERPLAWVWITQLEGPADNC